MDVDVRILGIPAIANVTHYFRQEPMGRWVDSDLDAQGYVDLEYTICDKRGRPAPWLERKMKQSDHENLWCDVLNKIEEDKE